MAKKQKKPTQHGFLVWKYKNRPRGGITQIIQIGTEWGTTGVNHAIGEKLGSLGHKAIEEIRVSIMLMTATRIATMDADYIPSTCDDWSPRMIEVWSRFCRWHKDLDQNRPAREAVMLFAKGEKLRDIERSVRIRSGTARTRIEQGVKAYVDLLKGKREARPRTAKPKSFITPHEFVASRIVVFED